MQSAPAHSETPAPPPLVATASSSTPVTFMDVLNFIVYAIFTVVAVYYGWTMGQKYAVMYWTVVQKFGENLRTWVISTMSSIRQQRAAYTAATQGAR
jgi:hypothetical protein